MKLSRLTFSAEECIKKIYSICSKSNITVSKEDKSGHVILNLNDSSGREGMIRIYDSKKGRTLDGSQKDNNFNAEIITEFQSLYCGNDNASIIDKWSVYKINGSQFEHIKQVIEETAQKNGYLLNPDPDIEDFIYYRIKVKGQEFKDSITVTQFNSGKLLIQGTGWQTWDDVCESVERELNASVKEILVRYIPTQENEKIDCIITNTLLETAENEVKSRLGQAYEYLYEHDRKLLVSSKAQLLANINYGDFYCYVAPALKVIEGYLIKLIVDLGIKTETEILERKSNGKPKFNFGQIFDGNTSMQSDCKNILIDTSVSTIDQKERALMDIYDKYSWCRSPYQHDGVPPISEVNDYEEAEDIFDQIMGMIKSTYGVLCIK